MTQRTARCLFCGETFAVTNRSGPEPSYCSPAHRQRAYEARRRTGRSEIEQAMASELEALRGRVRSLELDNKRLRHELHATSTELIELRHQVEPPSEIVRRLTGLPHASQPLPSPAKPDPPRRRRWRPTSR